LQEDFEVRADATDYDPTLKISIKLQGIGLSLINNHLIELAYFGIRSLELNYSVSPTFQTIGGKIKWIQVIFDFIEYCVNTHTLYRLITNCMEGYILYYYIPA